jgi:hypothetical protein
MVGSDGRLWWARPTIADHRAMYQRPPGLARGRMQSMQDAGEPAAGLFFNANQDAGGLPWN